MLQPLGRVVDQHGQPGAGSARAGDVLAGHVLRDRRVFVRQIAEFLQHRQQFRRIGLGLEKGDGLGAVGEVRVGGLPDFPGVHLGDVLVRWQAGNIDHDLGPGGDAHVVGQGAGTGVGHVLRIAHQVHHGVTPEGTGYFFVGRRVVGLTTQGVVVERGTDHRIAHQPHLAGVGQEGVLDVFLRHAPLDQQAALDTVPELQRVDEVAGVGGVALLALGLGLGGIDPQPLFHATVGEVGEHRLDGVVVVALDPEHGLQGLAGQAVAFDQVAVVDVGRPGGGVDHEGVDALPLQAHDVFRHQLLPGPLEALAVARHRAFEDGGGEGDDVVQELAEALRPAALDQLVLDLGGHALHPLLGHLALLAHGLVLHLLGLLHQRLGVRGDALLVLAEQLLGHLHLEALLHIGRQVRHRGVFELPGAVQPLPEQGIAQPGDGGAAFNRGNP